MNVEYSEEVVDNIETACIEYNLSVSLEEVLSRSHKSFEKIPTGICIFGSEGEFIQMNKVAEDILGLVVDNDFSKYNLFSSLFISDENIEELNSNKIVRSQIDYNSNNVKDRWGFNVIKDHIRYIEILIETFSKDSNSDNCVGYIVNITDISKSINFFKDTHRLVKWGSWSKNLITGETVWSEEYYRFYEIMPFSIVPKDEFYFSYIHSQDLYFVQNAVERLISGEAVECNYRIVLPSGQIKYVKERAKPVKDLEGNVIKLEGTIQDITELKERELGLINNEKRLRLVLELAKSGYWEYYVDSKCFELHDFYVYPSGKYDDFIFKNPSLEDFLKVVVREDKYKLEEGINCLIRNGGSYEDIVRFVGKGELHWLLIRGACYYSNEKLVKIYGYAKDVTSENMYRKELVKAKEKAMESDRLKSVFLANMSHEIRTPMNSIIGFSDLLFHEDCDEFEQKEYLKLITKNSEYLLNIINDIIDVSIIETGRVKLSYSNVSIKDLLRDLYLEYSVIDKPVKLKLSFLMDDVIVHIDYTRLRQIVVNFITNAIKYTKEGEVEIACIPFNNKDFKIAIRDTGIGILENDLKMIFDRFHQINSTKDGAGLGLSICKGLADTMGLNIDVTSIEGKGSEFSIVIPSSFRIE